MKDSFFDRFGFGPADFLLPQKSIDPRKWSVIAVDQHTSEGDYWEQIKDFTGDSPSVLNMVLPEYYLERENVADRYDKINKTMEEYYQKGVFEQVSDSFVYIEREQTGGGIRRGLLGAVDLEKYDYTPGSGSMIRSSEQTVASRIPPRVRIRKEALLEFPHIIILCDDPENVLMNAAREDAGEKLYDFHLYESEQRLTGRKVFGQSQKVFCALEKLNNARKNDFLFAVGDGNHSLATAKAVYEEKKTQGVPSEELSMARYALCEVVNIREAGMPFLPIHRLLMDNIENIRRKAETLDGIKEYTFTCFCNGIQDELAVKDKDGLMPVAVMQRFIDRMQIPVDYIHDDNTLKKLSKKENTTGILLPPPQRDLLFGTVEKLGVLPRKTFSLGAGADKRYYYEGRKIK